MTEDQTGRDDASLGEAKEHAVEVGLTDEEWALLSGVLRGVNDSEYDPTPFEGENLSTIDQIVSGLSGQADRVPFVPVESGPDAEFQQAYLAAWDGGLNEFLLSAWTHDDIPGRATDVFRIRDAARATYRDRFWIDLTDKNSLTRPLHRLLDSLDLPNNNLQTARQELEARIREQKLPRPTVFDVPLQRFEHPTKSPKTSAVKAQHVSQMASASAKSVKKTTGKRKADGPNVVADQAKLTHAADTRKLHRTQ